MVQKNSKEVNAKHKKILDDLIKIEENKECADCNAKGPLWASTNIGVFLCIKCAGCHRKIGTHISTVRSVNLDEWTAQQIKSISEKGNGKVNAFYEATLKQSQKPDANTDDRSREEFVKAKYERKSFYGNGGESPVQVKEVREEKVQVETKVQQPEKKKEMVRREVKKEIIESKMINFDTQDSSSGLGDLFTYTPQDKRVVNTQHHERSQSAPVSPQKQTSSMFENTITDQHLLIYTPDVTQKKDSILSMFDEQPKKQNQQGMMFPPQQGQQQFRPMPQLGGFPPQQQRGFNQGFPMNQNRPMMMVPPQSNQPKQFNKF